MYSTHWARNINVGPLIRIHTYNEPYLTWHLAGTVAHCNTLQYTTTPTFPAQYIRTRTHIHELTLKLPSDNLFFWFACELTSAYERTYSAGSGGPLRKCKRGKRPGFMLQLFRCTWFAPFEKFISFVFWCILTPLVFPIFGEIRGFVSQQFENHENRPIGNYILIIVLFVHSLIYLSTHSFNSKPLKFWMREKTWVCVTAI